MEEVFLPVVICGMLFVVLPWIILHYMSQWRRAKGITIEDENLLDDLHETARRLDSRLDSIERIIAADNPAWKDGAISQRHRDELADRRAADRPDRLLDRR